MSTSTTRTTPAKRTFRHRLALTDADRQRIRRRYREHPGPQKDLIGWFEKQPGGRTLNQGNISRVLSSKYAYLDTDDALTKDLSKRRQTSGEWPDLEDALFQWQQQLQQQHGKVHGDMLKQMAAQLWEQSPRYAGQQQPHWSNGWLERFKKRYRLKERENGTRAGTEDGSAALAQDQAQAVNNNVNDAPDDTMQQFAAVGEFVSMYEPRGGDLFSFRRGDSVAPAPAPAPPAEPPTRPVEADGAEEGVQEFSNVTTKDALDALEKVRLWVLQQEDRQASHVVLLAELEASMRTKASRKASQRRSGNYLNRNGS